jgi:hypothetical protein
VALGEDQQWHAAAAHTRELPSAATGFCSPAVRAWHAAGTSRPLPAAPAADVWSVGALLLFAATGDAPVQGYASAQSPPFAYNPGAVGKLPSTYPAAAHSMLAWLMHSDVASRPDSNAALQRFVSLSHGMMPTGLPPAPGMTPPLHTLAPSRALTAMLRGGPAGGTTYAPVPAGVEPGAGASTALNGMLSVRTVSGGSTIVRFAPGAKVRDVLVTAADTLRVTSGLASCALVLDGRVLQPTEDIVAAVPAAEQTMRAGAALIDASALPCVFLVTCMPADALRTASMAEGTTAEASSTLVASTSHQPSVLSLAALGGVASAPVGLQLGLAAGLLPSPAALAAAAARQSGGANPPGLPTTEEELPGNEGLREAGAGNPRFKSGSSAAGGGAAAPAGVVAVDPALLVAAQRLAQVASTTRISATGC